jgi:hypothetical protein
LRARGPFQRRLCLPELNLSAKPRLPAGDLSSRAR